MRKTVQVLLTKESMKRWVKWNKNVGELLEKAVSEAESGFMIIMSVQGAHGIITLLNCDGVTLDARGFNPAMVGQVGHVEKSIGDLMFEYCKENPRVTVESDPGISEDSISIIADRHSTSVVE